MAISYKKGAFFQYFCKIIKKSRFSTLEASFKCKNTKKWQNAYEKLGFLAKIYVIYSLVDADQLLGALFLIMVSAISVYYYLRVIKVIYFESKGVVPDSYKFKTVYATNLFSLNSILIALCLFLLVFFFFYPTSLLLICEYLVVNSFWF